MPALRSLFVVGFLLASHVLAHGGSYTPPPPPPPPPGGGGQYGGPGDVTPPGGPAGPAGPTTGVPSGPSASGPSGPRTAGPAGPVASPSGPAATGGPAGPSAPGPAARAGGARTGARGLTLEHDFETWDYWWEFNKNRYLMLRETGARAVQTGSDDFYLGATRREVIDTQRPTVDHAVKVVLPELKRAIDASTNRDIATACMVAMAKIGRDHPEFELVDVFVPQLKVGDQEVRETAALALGVMARKDGRSLSLLEGLALDSASGRAAYGGAVDYRTRAFATYGLGLTAHGSAETATKQRVFAVLRQLVEGGVARDVRVAAIQGIGLLAPKARSYEGAKLREDAVSVLGSWFDRDLGPGEEFVQAHCPTAMAKLLVSGDAAAGRWCDRFASVLAGTQSERRRGNSITQSCALALGHLATPGGKGQSIDHSAVLLEATRSHQDALTRYFALIALGQIGGADNRAALLTEFDRSKNMRKPWCALALGVLAHGERDRQARDHRVVAPDLLVVSTLQQALAEANEPGLVGALAIALGLCGATDAAPMMRERLLGGVAKEQMAGYLCIGLALMREPGAADDIRKVMDAGVRRPELLVQAAVALGKLGDREAAATMLARMGSGQANLSQLASFAIALSQIGDRNSIAPLVRMLHDERSGALHRAFAAVALGGICDWRLLPWSTPISANINYRAAVETLTDQNTGILDIL